MPMSMARIAGIFLFVACCAVSSETLSSSEDELEGTWNPSQNFNFDDCSENICNKDTTVDPGKTDIFAKCNGQEGGPGGVWHISCSSPEVEVTCSNPQWNECICHNKVKKAHTVKIQMTNCIAQ